MSDQDHKLNPTHDLPSPPQASEIRRHYFLDRYVIIAPKRSRRPSHFHDQKADSTDTKCPFCGHRELTLLSLPKGRGWKVKVVANLFPAVAPNNPAARGAHEIVIESPDHLVRLSDLATEDIRNVFSAWSQRQETLLAGPEIKYVQVFKNVGRSAGASLEHAHSQIIALPFAPPSVTSEAQALRHYRRLHRTCGVCDLMMWERQERIRVIRDDESFMTLAPYAASSPYGLWILPNRHLGRFAELNQEELLALASHLKGVLKKLDSIGMAYNLFLHDAPQSSEWHWSLKIEPRSINVWAGFELGTGVIINPVAPEAAAAWYRE